MQAQSANHFNAFERVDNQTVGNSSVCDPTTVPTLPPHCTDSNTIRPDVYMCFAVRRPCYDAISAIDCMPSGFSNLHVVE